MTKNIGIDLGTTNVVVASAGKVLELKQPTDATGSLSLPSVVAFPPNGGVLVGAIAKRRRAIDPVNTVRSAKRLMGKDMNAVAIPEFKKRYPVDLAPDAKGHVAFKTREGLFTPTEIASILLDTAVRAAGMDPAKTNAVITVPASFSATQKEATNEAAKLAGLAKTRILEEPVATAFAHRVFGKGKYAAVYDIGGGTFDFAVLETSGNVVQVLGHGGDPFLGGDDVDSNLAAWAANELVRLHNWDVRGDVEAMDRLTLACERAKIELSLVGETRIDLGQVEPDTPVADAQLVVDRAALSEACGALVRSTFITCDEVLRQVGVSPRQIDTVLLAGGTTLIPLLAKSVEAYFGRTPRHDVSPLHSVALGADHLAQRAFG